MATHQENSPSKTEHPYLRTWELLRLLPCNAELSFGPWYISPYVIYIHNNNYNLLLQ
jgi:hypothetical protein